MKWKIQAMKKIPSRILLLGLLLGMQSFVLQAMNGLSDSHAEAEILRIREDIPTLREYITTEKAAGTLPSLTDLIEEHQAQPGDHTYIALFITYCLAHTEEELKPLKAGLKSLTYGGRLFKIAQTIRTFTSDDNAYELFLSYIPEISYVLNNLLDILQSLTTKTITNLDLSGNNLTEVPEDFGNNLPNLQTLCLLDNDITILPKNFGNNLPNLNILRLDGKVSVPAELRMRKLLITKDGEIPKDCEINWYY